MFIAPMSGGENVAATAREGFAPPTTAPRDVLKFERLT